jgi:RNA polymerase sigma-70 factor (ECF subfamily)
MNQTNLINQRFEALFNELKAPVFSYIQSIIRNHQDSEEILQETFLALYQQIQNNRDLEYPKAWTYRVAGNFCLSRLRRQSNLIQLLKLLSTNKSAEAHAGQGTEEQVIRNQEMDILDSLIVSLHPKHRAIVMLYRDGFTYQQIAEMTHTRVGTVGVTIRRAVMGFEKKVRSHGGGQHVVSE